MPAWGSRAKKSQCINQTSKELKGWCPSKAGRCKTANVLHW